MRILSPLAKKWNFNLHTFGEDISLDKTNEGTMTLAAQDELEPSPVSDHEDPRFSLLAGTIRGVFGEDVIVAPVLLTGESRTSHIREDVC